MNRFRTLCLLLLAAACAAPAVAQRQDLPLNHDWLFRFSHQVRRDDVRRVDLPHTWNAQDALAGRPDYKRGIGNYTRRLYVRPEWAGKRLFLRFEGANSVADLFVDGRHVGEHRGGYTAFVFEITDRVACGREHTIDVRVNNGEQLDVMPLVGDFNFYGGLYRDVHLILTDSVCISPLNDASPGLFLDQLRVDGRRAEVRARVDLSNAAAVPRRVVVRLRIADGDRTVFETERPVVVAPRTAVQEERIDFAIERPHLWDGVADPFLYRAEAVLLCDGAEIDRVEQPLGLRSYATDPDRGFFLNGRHLPLRGVCRHQERAEVGNALRREHHDEDFALMAELGANAVRLAHYPQAEYVYDLADRHGLVVWAEIPFVGPGGYADKGFVDSPSFRANGRQQLREMIRQHYNHPSICFWGLFNELKEQGDNPVAYVRELDSLAHAEDASRPTVAASNQSGALNLITDLIAWNRYDGWYGATPASLASWLDATHAAHPGLKIGISEYGAGASILHQQDSLAQPRPDSWWHPENWQTEYHVLNWAIIRARPYVWGSFVWNLFDFGAAHRTEGDRPGINDKGLVTHDRRVRKDAFYFYKANWNPEPMVRIEGRRNDRRVRSVTTVRVFSNCAEVELRVNGRAVASARPDTLRICTFGGVVLRPGDNLVEAVARDGATTLEDRCTWHLE